ncbi:MAG: GSCFA domain-containing protein [Rhodobacterales bacterium]|jgi:hypothetical protein|nr:GSCFA domain-containing protein [Rhodobacterales bacterium]
MSHPYVDLPPSAFWRTAVAEVDRNCFPGLYEPRLTLVPATGVATAGSCFAQHIGHRLRISGCNVLDAEPVPAAMNETVAQAFGYALFSSRTGNIYTTRQLRQFLTDINEGYVDARFVWAKGPAFIDALRPTVEPEGLSSPKDVLLHRTYHLERTARMLRNADLFVFTLGLTECWEDRPTGRVFPICPGVVGGLFDPHVHAFRNLRYLDVLQDLEAIRELLHRFNPAMQMLLTVSPVPLTATVSGDHVMTATTASKAILRAAADEFVKTTPGTDYFPSFEIITQPASGGPWFEANMRRVSAAGVDKVMGIFLSAHGIMADPPPAPKTVGAPETASEADEIVCDEILLDEFSR